MFTAGDGCVIGGQPRLSGGWSLPGDELIRDPADMTTLALPIEAPAADVWPWLLQIGQDRAGFYSYDRLENLVGLHIHSADQIVDQWQTLSVGDSIRLTPSGWMGQPDGLVLPVARLEAPRSLVLREGPPSCRGTQCGPSISCRPQPAAAA